VAPAHPSALALVAIAWAASVDVTNHVRLGPVSLSGVATSAFACVLLILVPVIPLSRSRISASHTLSDKDIPARVPVALVIFTAWAIFRLVAAPTVEGIQNVSVYVLFVAGIGLTAVTCEKNSAELFHRWLSRVAVLACAMYLASLWAGFPIFSARPFALTALVFLAVLIPNKPTGHIFRLAPYFVAFTVAMSLSRTATVIAVGMLILIVVRGKARGHVIRGLSRLSAAVLGAYLLITYYTPMHDRFLGGDAALTLGGIQLNTSGRIQLWQFTMDSASKSPIFGQGPGSAADLITARFPNIDHPHNDYLRIYHDFGLIGLLLFVSGYAVLLWTTSRRAHYTNGPVHWAASLGLLAVALSAITDNAFVYPFVMLPLSCLVGLSLGASIPELHAPSDIDPGGTARSPRCPRQKPRSPRQKTALSNAAQKT